MRRILLILCLAWSLQALGATPQVPSRMSLTDIQLKLTIAGKKRVQEMVDSLTKSEKYFQVLLDRANLFLPIVARVLEEENIPADLKYLVLQESGLISDAVSKSNAVGFWQFKDFTAAEVGLQINGHVDERMHITAATRGAARYLKINNEYLDNWFYTMLAYKDGRGHVQRNTDYKKYRGAKKMRIDGHTHWYIIHFLAYKVVFEDKLGQERHPELCLHEYEAAHGKTLEEIAKTFGVDQERLQEHNKWLKRYRVPYETTCTTIIPLTHEQYTQRQGGQFQPVLEVKKEEQKIDYTKYGKQPAAFPVITTKKYKNTDQILTIINGIPGAIAQAADSLETLARAGHISIQQLLAINELDQAHQVAPGQVYYFKSKNSKAGTHFHVTQPGETWWSVAQQYGIKKEQLLLKNRLRQEVELQAGRVLWLRFIRPRHIPVAYEYPQEENTVDRVETTTLTSNQEAPSPVPAAPTSPAAYEEQGIFEPDN